MIFDKRDKLAKTLNVQESRETPILVDLIKSSKNNSKPSITQSNEVNLISKLILLCLISNQT